MVNRIPLREVDPDSPRLTPDDVIEIHKAHLAGEGWHSVAKRVGTNWKNVSRIVNGHRWADLHPSRRPDLYTDQAESPNMASILDDLEEIQRRVASITAAVGRHDAPRQMT